MAEDIPQNQEPDYTKIIVDRGIAQRKATDLNLRIVRGEKPAAERPITVESEGRQLTAAGGVGFIGETMKLLYDGGYAPKPDMTETALNSVLVTSDARGNVKEKTVRDAITDIKSVEAQLMTTQNWTQEQLSEKEQEVFKELGIPVEEGQEPEKKRTGWSFGLKGRGDR